MRYDYLVLSSSGSLPIFLTELLTLLKTMYNHILPILECHKGQFWAQFCLYFRQIR